MAGKSGGKDGGKGGSPEKPHQKHEGFFEHAKHTLTDAIYGKPKPKAVAKPVEKAPHPTEKKSTAAAKPLEKTQHPTDKTQGATDKTQHATDKTQHATEKKTTSANAHEKTPHTSEQKPHQKGLNFDQLKHEGMTVLKGVTKPLEQTLKTVEHQLHKSEKAVEDAILHRQPERRQPRQMSAEQAKHEHNITSMKPEERARLKLYQAEDPKTHTVFNYNKKGLLVEAETLNGQHKHIQYKGESKELASFKITQQGHEDKPLAQGKADGNHRLQVDQRTGDLRVDSKQVSPTGKTQNLEEHYAADGTHSKIVSEHGVRVSKEIYTPQNNEFKKTSTLDYQYTDDKNRSVPPEKVGAKTKCSVTQTDAHGAVRHQYEFKSATDVKDWKPTTQTDISQPKKAADGATHQTSQTFDLTRGKRLIAETDTTTKADQNKVVQQTENYTVENGKTKTKISSSETTQVMSGSVITQTTDAYNYKNGKEQKAFHSQESFDKANGNSVSESYSYKDGRVVAKDFSRKEVAETSGETKVITSAIRNAKTVQHREAQFDSEGKPVSLQTDEGKHTYLVKFGKDGKVANDDGKPAISKDGKPLLDDGMSDQQKKAAQLELKTVSLDATRYMQDVHERFDVRAQVKIKQQEQIPNQGPNQTPGDRGSQTDKAPDSKKADSPHVFSEEEKNNLRQKALEVHKLAGYDNYVFTYADTKGIQDVLETLKTQDEIDEFKRQYKQATNADLEEQLGKCRDFKSYGAYRLQALLSADESTKTACEIRCAMEEYQATGVEGRSKWECATYLRKTLSHLDHEQMKNVEAQFNRLYPGQGSIHGNILSSELPQEIKDAIPYYARGTDNLSQRDKLKMADIAVGAKNVDMLKEVASQFDDATREQFSKTERQKQLSEAFSGKDLNQAQAAVQGGGYLISQEIRDNTGVLTTNREAVRAALSKLTDDDRRRYEEGRNLEGQTNLSPDKQKSLDLYRSLHGAINGTGIRSAEIRGLEDSVLIKGGGLVSMVSKGDGVYVDGVQTQLDRVANMSEQDWQKVHDYVKGVNGKAHPEYRQELERTMRDMKGIRIGETEITKILALYDRKIGADNFNESKLVGQKDIIDTLSSQRGYIYNDRGAALEAVSRMTPAEQKLYRTDSQFRQQVDAELEHYKQTFNQDAYDQAHRMLNMYRQDDSGVFSQFRTINNLSVDDRKKFAGDTTAMKNLQTNIDKMAEGDSKQSALRMLKQLQQGRPPEMIDVLGRLSAKRSDWFGDPHETVKIMEQAFQEDPSLLKRVQNPVTAEDKQLAAQFKELSTAAFGHGKDYGQELINSKDGRLELTQKLEMHRHWLYTDRQGIIDDLASASKSDQDLLKDRNSDLRKQVDAEMRTWCRVFNGAEERDRGQQQVVEKILATGKVEDADRLRGYMVDVGHSSKVMEIIRNASPQQLDQICADYEKHYHRDLRVDLKEKLSKSDSSEALGLLYKPTNSEELYRHLLNQYLETRSGFGSAFADHVGRSGTGYQIDNDINHIAATIIEAHRSGKPLSPEQERVLLNNINNSVESFTRDMSNFKESKSACAEYTAQGVMAALTVLGAIASGGTSLVAEGGLYAGMETTAVGVETATAGVQVMEGVQALNNGSRALSYMRNGIEFVNSAHGNALMNTGLQMAMMGKDYDPSSIPVDLVSGYAQGKIFEVFSGPRALGFLKLGESAAARTSEHACTTLLKHEEYGLTRALTTAQGRLAFENSLKKEIAHHVRESWLLGAGKELAPGAFRSASGKALRDALEIEIKQTAKRAGTEEIEKLSKQEVQKRVKQELEKLVEQNVGAKAMRQMETDIAAQVRASSSKLTPTKIVERRIEEATMQHLSEMAGGSCERVIANSFLDASQIQTKNMLRGLIEHSVDNSRLLRFGRGMGISLFGAGVGGSVSGTIEGIVQWDANKSFEENMSAMREHIEGSVFSSIIGAAQMHPLGMIAHHYQQYMSRPGTHVLAAHEETTGTSHDLKNGSTGFTEYSGGQTISEGSRVVSIRDAEGRQSRIAYDETGHVARLERSTESGAERWTQIENGKYKVETARGTKIVEKTVQVESDGRTVFKNPDGTSDLHHLDGTVQHVHADGKVSTIYISEHAQRQKFENLVKHQVSDASLNARLRTDIDIVTERLITSGHSRTELAKVYQEANHLLSEAARADISKERRLQLQRTAEESLWLAAHPTLVSQGHNPTCPLASAESRAWTLRPAETMRMVRELATTGAYVCPDGTVLKPFTAGGEQIFAPDVDARSHYEGPYDRVNGNRLATSQMLQTLMVSAAFADHSYFNGKNVGKGNIGYLDNHIVDMSTNPPHILSTERGPEMHPSDVKQAFAKLTGLNEDFVLVNRRYQDSLNVDPNFTFDSPEELAARLFGNQKRGRLPISIQLNTGHEPFYSDSGAHRTNGKTGEHMLNIVKIEVAVNTADKRSLHEISPAQLFDGHTGKLKVNPEDVVLSLTNQWDKSANHLAKPISLTELFRATNDALDTRNLRSIENELAREPHNLNKQLDLLRYKNNIEKHCASLEEAAKKNPAGPEAKELARFNPTTDRISTDKLLAEVEQLTNLKTQEIANRPQGLQHATKEDVRMLEKATALMQDAIAHHHADVHLPSKQIHGRSANQLHPGTEHGAPDTELKNLKRRVTEIEARLEANRTACLEDTKVPGTLSEFGLEYKLSQTIQEASELDHIVVAFIDLNNFKKVNTYHSMQMGDKALNVWAEEAAKILRSHGIEPREGLAHFGGDEFGILLKNCAEHKQVLEEIMRIRVGCKPISDDPHNQENCELRVLKATDTFNHQSFEKETKNGAPVFTKQPSPIISASLGAIEWKPGMTSADVMNLADKIMFEKKPLVKAQLATGGDAVINPFSNKIELTYNTPESEHLQLYRQLGGTQKAFSLHGGDIERIRDYCRKEFTERVRLFFDLLNKHAHTKIFDRVKSKEILGKYINSAESAASAGSTEPPFTIIRLAVDNFKSVNDEMQSHAKGNRVLNEVGKFVRDLDDVDFVGSLGGTSPFLIVKDPSKVQEILDKCDKFFLEVSHEKPDPFELVGHYSTAKERGNIAVGLSAAGLRWTPGMDIETLLNAAEKETDEVQKKHIAEGRHTRRALENEGVPPVEGQPQRRSTDAPPSVSLARNEDHFRSRDKNVPDAPSGKWTYHDVDTTKRTVTGEYMNNKMRVRDAIIHSEETENGSKVRTLIGYKNVHPFFRMETVNEFVEDTSALLRWKNGKPESLEARRVTAEEALNKFLQDRGYPPIRLEAGELIDKELTKEGARALYRDGLGCIAVRTKDLLNAGAPTFIAALYHELVHVEQDVTMIRACGLDVSQAAHGNYPTDKVRLEYAKTRGHNKVSNPLEATPEEYKQFGDWFNKVLSADHSVKWITDRKEMNKPDLLANDAEYRRANWLLDTYRTGDIREQPRIFRESKEAVKERAKELSTSIDASASHFNGNEAKFLKNLQDSSEKRIKTYGYDPLDSRFNQRDQLFMELLLKDRIFSDAVEHGERANWIPAYEKEYKKRIKAIEANIKALDKEAPSYDVDLRNLEEARRALPPPPRTLQLLTRWELKGLLHGMAQQDFEPPEGYFGRFWNKSLAEHIQLVHENAVNQKARIDYSKTMRHGAEQEAYATMPSMEHTAYAHLLKLREQLDTVHGESSSEDRGLIYSKEHPFKEDLRAVSDEELRKRVGSNIASEHNIEWITEHLANAGDQIITVNPDKARLKIAEENFSTRIEKARKAIYAELAESFPANQEAREARLHNQEKMRHLLRNHPELLQLYNDAMDAYKTYNELYRDELNAVRRHNAEYLNGALKAIAQATDTPPLEIFTTELGRTNAAIKMGTNRLYFHSLALSGRVPIDKLITDISHELLHNMQNAKIVRALANELNVGKEPTHEEILHLQKEYMNRVNQKLEESYLLESLKDRRKLPDQEQKGIDSLIESFAQVRHVEDLQGEVKLCDWALNKLSSYRGAGELIASAFAEGENRGWTTEEIMQNSRLAYVLPQTNLEHLMRTVKAYERGGEEWKALEPDVRLTWSALISGAREKWQTALAEHDKLYPNWKHEKEASAFSELVARHLNKTNKDRWKDIQYDMGNLKNYNVDLE